MGGSGVRPRGKGIEIDFRYRGMRCRELIKLPPTKANLKYAANLRAALLTEIARGTFQYQEHFPDSSRCALFGGVRHTRQTVAQALDSWLTGAKATVEDSTWNEYRKVINRHLTPGLGHIPIRDLTTATVKAWVATLPQSGKTINNILTPLRQTTADAFGDSMLERDPMIRVPSMKFRTREPDPFTPDEIRRILTRLSGQALAFYQFAIWTGLRPSEQIALRWEDVDLELGVVRVRRARVRRQEKDTKTIAGERTVRLLAPALEALTAQKEITYLSGKEVFLNPRTGRPWVSEKALREVDWKHALRAAKVAYRTPYQCRHTYASMMLAAGENPMWVARQMGHGTVQVMYKNYARWMPEAAPDAGRKADQMVTRWSQE